MTSVLAKPALKTVGIVNTGLSNLGSVESAFSFYPYPVQSIHSPSALKSVDLIVLAGVGNFKAGIQRLREGGWVDALNEQVLGNQKPVLGMCLGMQLFADVSLEDGEHEGLGWIPGKVVPLDGEAYNVRVPHIGWNQVMPVFDENVDRPHLLSGMRYGDFYFMHSYHMVPQQPDDILATTRYGNLTFVSAVQHRNIVGVQFHPEKSQGDGLRFIRHVLDACFEGTVFEGAV